MAVTEPLTLVLRYADVGVASYASLRIVGQPERTVTWVVAEQVLVAVHDELGAALPDPRHDETPLEGLARALSEGAFTTPSTELSLAYRLGALLISEQAWQLLTECVTSPRAVLFIAPSARLGRVPWSLLAKPTSFPAAADVLENRTEAVTVELTEGYRLMELVDVLMAVPTNIAASRRATAPPAGGDPLLILDPRVPGQRPDSTLGSVLGRPAPDTLLARHYAGVLQRQPVLPRVDTAVELFRRTDADRSWLARMLAQRPGRLVFVGHASVADGDVGHADRAALHLACHASTPGLAEPIGDHRPLTAADLMAADLVFPCRVALLACASGGDYRFDEATGLVAAMVLGGAQIVTATLWSLPTTAGYRRFADSADHADPMGEVIAAVDTAHQQESVAEAGRAVNRWQREQMRRWRDGDTSASPVYWAALATFALSQAGGTHTATADSSPRR
ncbi:CHAT domain-containing protein [Mycolicibacterium canariasense]|nr:CHAT domain-containing protein [Mycolicibacterium canariasense]MCV7212965.1 CHAT domain-containing protein [Mycolicibacterium canariasense]